MRARCAGSRRAWPWGRAAPPRARGGRVGVGASSEAGALRRLAACVPLGGVGAGAVGGGAVVVRGKLEHIPSQPARQKVPKTAGAPPPIALPLVLQANPPVPSI